MFEKNLPICYNDFMIKDCKNCGGKLYFSPKNKGHVCESCGSIFPIKYNYNFKKKSFDENVDLKVDELASSLKNIRCKSCGANIMLSKYQIQTTCPYCGSTTIEESKKKKLMYIDSIIPFSFGKAEALKKFKSTLNKKFYANKKIFKNITKKDINGAYVNTFVFDMVTTTRYSGVLKYTKMVTNKDGESKAVTKYKDICGEFDKVYKNLTVEANSNLEQRDLYSIMPFQYASAVDFQDDFMHGYMLEYQDKMFNDCVAVAEGIIEKDIKNELLKKYECDSIVHLTLNTNYIDKKYNYCLLPVYFVNKIVKDRKYTAVMNGQTGKVGRLPKSALRVFMTIFVICAFVVGAIILALYFSGKFN